MEDNVKNIIKDVKEQKKYNKEFYASPLFFLIEESFQELRGSRIIEDKDEIQWINSLLEMNRDKIFYKSFYKYGLALGPLIIEKYYLDRVIYLVHNKDDYIKKIAQN